MNEQECKICKQLTREKYKNAKTWKITAIVFIFLTVLLAILYFVSGKMFIEKTVENDIQIENNGDGDHENNIVTGNGATISGTITTESNIGVIILLSCAILSGGIICGSYIILQRKSD